VQVAVQEFLGKAITAAQELAIIILLAVAAVQTLLGRMPAAQLAATVEAEKHHPYLAAHMLVAVAAAAIQWVLAVPVAAAMVRRATTPTPDQVRSILAAALVVLHLNVVAEFLALLAALV
jgi:hypothetical protein